MSLTRPTGDYWIGAIPLRCTGKFALLNTKATVEAEMTNQDGEIMATGTADILLPAP